MIGLFGVSTRFLGTIATQLPPEQDRAAVWLACLLVIGLIGQGLLAIIVFLNQVKHWRG